MTQAYPLSWPTGWKRTPRHQILTSKFHKLNRNNWEEGYRGMRSKVTIAQAVEMVMHERWLLRAGSVKISSNLTLTTYGEPRSGQREPDDHGVAVYFELKRQACVLACDKWSTCADNLAAIAKHLDALRAQERYGVGTVEQAFTGYAALPPPKTWRDVLGINSNNIEDVEKIYKVLAKTLHPDQPSGSNEKMVQLNAAIDAARRELT